MKEKKVYSKNGTEFVMKEIGPEYAVAYLDYFKQVSGDTHYMSCYGDEIGTAEKDIENQREQLRTLY